MHLFQDISASEHSSWVRIISLSGIEYGFKIFRLYVVELLDQISFYALTNMVTAIVKSDFSSIRLHRPLRIFSSTSTTLTPQSRESNLELQAMPVRFTN